MKLNWKLLVVEGCFKPEKPSIGGITQYPNLSQIIAKQKGRNLYFQ